MQKVGNFRLKMAFSDKLSENVNKNLYKNFQSHINIPKFAKTYHNPSAIRQPVHTLKHRTNPRHEPTKKTEKVSTLASRQDIY